MNSERGIVKRKNVLQLIQSTVKKFFLRPKMLRLLLKRKYKNIEKYLIFALICILIFGDIQLMILEGLEGKTELRPTLEDPEFLARLRGPLKADSPAVLKILKQKFMQSPSKEPYNLMVDKDSEEAESYNAFRTGFESYIRCKEILQRFFNNSSPGVFIESGAMDGEFISNTLYLEETLGWRGMLIEPDTRTYNSLLKKNRKSWSSNTCISSRNYPTNVSFITYSSEDASILDEMLTRSTSNVDGIHPPAAGLMGTKQRPVSVQCFPLYSYILAMNKTSIDYISLDVEGKESEILITFPWTKVNVTVWSIEHRLLNDHFKDYMIRKGKMHTLSNRTETIFENYFNSKNPDNDVANTTSFTVESNDTMEIVIKHERKVVYTSQHSPQSGIDDYFIDFMYEKGYQVADYWDGDYTFVKRNTPLWHRIIKDDLFGLREKKFHSFLVKP